MSYTLRPLAERDIEEIISYIAKESPAAASRWLGALKETFARLADMPRMGLARPEIRPEMRSFVTGNYLIAYREVECGVEIVRVLHGARQWQELL
jgi:toxin ParE1/3/4